MQGRVDVSVANPGPRRKAMSACTRVAGGSTRRKPRRACARGRRELGAPVCWFGAGSAPHGPGAGRVAWRGARGGGQRRQGVKQKAALPLARGIKKVRPVKAKRYGAAAFWGMGWQAHLTLAELVKIALQAAPRVRGIHRAGQSVVGRNLWFGNFAWRSSCSFVKTVVDLNSQARAVQHPAQL